MQVSRIKLTKEGSPVYSFSSKKRRPRSKARRSQPKSGRKRSQKKSTSKKPKRKRVPCQVIPTLLSFLNTLQWDVSQTIDKATYMGRAITLDEQNQVLCRGKISLLLPAAKVTTESQLAVLYEVPVTKPFITVGDVLDTIWKFYNYVKVTQTDLKHITFGMKAPPISTASMHFIDFHQQHSAYVGLVPQDNGLYLLQLGPSGSTSVSSLLR